MCVCVVRMCCVCVSLWVREILKFVDNSLVLLIDCVIVYVCVCCVCVLCVCVLCVCVLCVCVFIGARDSEIY